MNSLRFNIIILTIFFLAASVYTQNVRSFRVIDGDSVSLLYEIGNRELAELSFIDAPELDQDYGTYCKSQLESLLATTSLEFLDYGTTIEDRSLIVILGRQDAEVNLRMLELGCAWLSDPSDPDLEDSYIKAERIAKEKKIGLFSSPDAIHPREFRELNKRKRELIASKPECCKHNVVPDKIILHRRNLALKFE